jgi:methylmalonyl-CoA/ethylmalonyl-CoA epimerase
MKGAIAVLTFTLLFTRTQIKAEENMTVDGSVLKTQVVTQVGIVVKDIEKTSRAFAALFAVDVPQVVMTDPVKDAHTEFHGQSTKARAKLAFFHLENITIELIEPIDKPSTWQEFLDTHGEGVHHIAFEIKDTDGKIKSLEKMNMLLIQKGDYKGGRYSYIDSAPQLGVILELLENH